MPSLSEFGSGTNLPIADLIKISESQITNPSSRIFKVLVEKVSQKYLAQQRVQNDSDSKRSNHRVYVPYAVDVACRYELQSAFPQFDMRFVGSTIASAVVARTVSLFVSEYLLTMVPHREKNVLAYGFQVIPTIMRNRNWVHLCNSGADPAAQAQFKRSDRELSNIYDSMVHARRVPPLALTEYMQGRSRIVCQTAHSCKYESTVGVAMFDHVDTNLTQVAYFMRQHHMKLLYFAVPGNKAMEMGYSAPFPELGGHVVVEGARIHVVFPGDLEYQMAFTASNYKELVARTRVVIESRTYVKEFVNRVSGYLVYKVTATTGEHFGGVDVYRSWTDPDYRDLYLLTVPQLKFGGDPANPYDWSLSAQPIKREIVDEITNLALSADGVKLDEIVMRRLYSKSYNFIVAGQMTRNENPLTLQQFLHAAMTIYAFAFMRKYQSGTIVSTMAPAVRQAARSGGIMRAVKGLASTAADWMYMELIASSVARAREFVGSFDDKRAIQLPMCEAMPGYVEYRTDARDAKSYTWDNGVDPVANFDIRLPALSACTEDFVQSVPFRYMEYDDIPQAKTDVVTKLASFANRFRDALSFSDPQEAMYDEEQLEVQFMYHHYTAGGLQHHDALDMLRNDGFDEVHISMIVPFEVVVESGTPASVIQPRTVTYELRRFPIGQRTLVMGEDPQKHTELADELVARVLGDVPTGMPQSNPIVYNAYLAPDPGLVTYPGAVSVTPLQDLEEAILKLFPVSMLIDTTYMEAERLYSDKQFTMKTLLTKVDITRYESLKPESSFAPIVRGHVLPHIKENPSTVLATLEKRNTNTPYAMTPADMSVLWGRVWDAMQRVYFVDGAASWISSQFVIQTNETNLREWLVKISDSKVANLLRDEDGFLNPEMLYNISHLHLMLKGKLKPEMDASYDTSLKLPQSVQYDPTGKFVAMLSPAFRDLVKREQFLLRPNVMVMQRKSPDDIVRFLNMFDHRPDSRGERTYIEIDQCMFDKSQVREIAEMYCKYLHAMGFDPEYVTWIMQSFNRDVSSMKAGVKTRLRHQNVSGAPYTLHRNNAVSLMIMALLLDKIADKIEFMMVMGDDFTIAVRGSVDISKWEEELSKMFNMSAKIKLQTHGYICSQDIVHRSDGTTTLVRDPVKAALAYMQMDYKDESKFQELFESFKDSMRYVDDAETQFYLERVLPTRWKHILPGADGQVFHLLARVHSAVKSNPAVLRSFFSESTIQKFY